MRPFVLAALLPFAHAQEPARPKTPAELWESFEKEGQPGSFAVDSDRVVASDVHPTARLRRVDFTLTSQRLFGKEQLHRGTLYIPAAAPPAERRGKVVIIGGIAPFLWDSFLINYAQPIAVELGYPAMVLQVPGLPAGEPNRHQEDIKDLLEHVRLHKDPSFHHFFRLAIPFVRALDVSAAVLEVDRRELRAIVGGHSKRATAAFTAAAIRPDNIAGVIYMGNESTFEHRAGTPLESTSPYFTQEFVRCPRFYLGATNEGGYAMFNVNRFMENMRVPWTIEMVPNYRHAAESEKMFLAWRMFVSHVFDGRPLARISGLRALDSPRGTTFQAEIATANTLVLAKLWYVYCDDPPYWRDLMWYPVPMRRKEGDLFEAYAHGKTPDAWLVEVLDAGRGVRGYVTSLPQNLTAKESKVLPPATDGHPRLWRAEKQGGGER